MMRYLFGNESELICLTPGNWPIGNSVRCSRSSGRSGGITGYIPPTAECFANDGVVRFFGHFRTTASMKGGQVPPYHLYHPVARIAEVGNPHENVWMGEEIGVHLQ